ncbi:MAG TPA: hypothetical protein VEW67_04165 [Thermoleophilaceae bacterium]|nr:hypothetical protein [Thermoleophilaceae bacterium]
MSDVELTMIETASGRYVDLTDPRPEAIDLADIAHGLAHICRYGGHARRFYSVAEHAVLVARRLADLGFPAAVQLAGLHHDDAEAYIGDVPRPLKMLLPDFREIERRVTVAIDERLRLPGLDADETCAVKEADDWALFVEARVLMPSRGEGWTNAPAHVDQPPWRLGLAAGFARAAWVRRHLQLVEAHDDDHRKATSV